MRKIFVFPLGPINFAKLGTANATSMYFDQNLAHFKLTGELDPVNNQGFILSDKNGRVHTFRESHFQSLKIDERMVPGIAGLFEPPAPFFRVAKSLASYLPVKQVRLFNFVAVRLHA